MTDTVQRKRTKRRFLTLFTGTEPPPLPEVPVKYPEVDASLLSRLTFSWISPLLKTGYLRTVEEQDLYSLEGTPVSAKALYEKFEQKLEKYRIKAQEQARAEGKSEEDILNAPLPRYALIRALHETFFYQWWTGGAYKVLSDVTQTTMPLVTRRLISFTAYREMEPIGKGVGYGICVVVMSALSAFFINQFFYRAMKTGAQTRAVLSQAIYLKSLRLSNKARLEFNSGKLNNMLSMDCHRVDFALQWFHFVWSFPISIGIGLAVIIINIGTPGLVGFALLFLSCFFVAFITRQLAAIRKRVNKITDSRVSIMHEILHSMKIIKFYAWEDAYKDRVYEIRGKEMKKIKFMLSARNLVNAFFVTTPTLAGLVSFVVLSATGKQLNPANVFSSLTSFNIMRFPLMILPLGLITAIEAYLALNRIESLLSAPEAPSYVEQDNDMPYAINIFGDYVWEAEEAKEDDKKDESSSDEKNSTSNVSETTTAEEEKKLAVDHELTRIHSRNAASITSSIIDPDPVEVEGDPSDTILESDRTTSETTKEEKSDGFKGFNSLNFKVEKGEFIMITGSIGSGKSSLLSACAGMMSRRSGKALVNGELIFCGQPWVQNATIQDNITFGKPFDREWYDAVVSACSLNHDLEILPAGDQTHVGERGITLSGGQKARINLARAVYWNADIVLLDDVLSAVDAHVGQHIIEHCLCGLMKDKTRVLATHQLSMLQHATRVGYLDTDGTVKVADSVEDLRKICPGFDHLMEYSHEETSEQEEQEEEENVKEEEAVAEKKEVAAKKPSSGKLMQDEDRAVDAVSLKIYMQYFKLGGGFLSYGMIPLLILMMVLTTFTTLFTNTWLSFWTADKFAGRSEGFYIGIFVMLGVSSAILSFFFFLLLTQIGNLTSLKLHIAAVDNILHAPMSFFDTSPLGRILNRFSKDTDTMDNEISDQARLFLLSLSNVVGVFILVIIYLPWFAIALVGLMAIFVAASMYYRASAREIKRLDALGRSYVFSHFGETLNGIATIKSYHEEERFVKMNEKVIDRMNSAYYLTLVNQRWLGLRLDMIGSGINLVVVMLCVTGQMNINPSSVGLVLSSLLQIIMMMSLMVREMATVENNMNSVERLYHYANDIDQEKPHYLPEDKQLEQTQWPQQGAIKLRDVTMSYRPGLPAVLKNVSLDIKPGEKVGICGRTGAGKSTIMVALYRIAELTGGTIEIDGVDISKIGLHKLRSKLSIIPQDPVLFQGTVRSNVDPFNTCSDMELWDALRRSWLVSDGNTKFTLDSSVDDEGANFSLGERQLLALARALVRRSKILVLDEATSSVDFETDSKIQSTLVTEFSECTVLCIAHRLRTILGYDRVLVMEAGEVAEFDRPIDLFKKENSVFRSLCDHSGITIEDFNQLNRGN
ncbi:oligomycin resistance ATP-dependent permease Yor1p [Trichomonascus vanleenenianus]|uniref:ATP-binding cassette transporter YOR1 n=1 Tax=Trichomonascus vanleenenianus TaxID=2268995 RepID=UPI003ECB4D49